MSDSSTKKQQSRLLTYLLANFCWRNNRYRLIYGSIGFLIVFIPSLILNILAKNNSLPWGNWPFYSQKMTNDGIAFGFLTNHPALIYVLQALIIAGLLIAILFSKSRICCVFLGMAFSAGLFNLCDRLHSISVDYPTGVVIDYLDTTWLKGTVSNLPDVFIICSIIACFITFIVLTIIEPKTHHPKTRNDDTKKSE